MRLKAGKKYKVRVLQEDDKFYPQIYVDSFWYGGWYFIDMESPNDFSGSLMKPPTIKAWNETLAESETVIRILKEKFATPAIKIHNEREEQF